MKLYLIIAALCATAHHFSQATHATTPHEKKVCASKTIDHTLDEALLEAADDGDEQTIRKLFAGDTIPDVNAKDTYGITPLMLAVSNGHTEVVQALIDAGAHVEAKNRYGDTALMKAALEGNTALVQKLIVAGADPNVLNEKHENRTARNYASDKAAYDKAVIAGLLELKERWKRFSLQTKAKMTKKERKLFEQANQELLQAAQKNDLTTMQALFEAAIRPDVNSRDVLGQTPLLFAARHVNLPMVKLLLARGADSSLSDDDGYTSLMEVLGDTTKQKHKDQLEIMTQLFLHDLEGTIFNTRTKKMGLTALMLAVLHNNTHAVSLLVIHADLNVQTKEGVTALMLAAQEHNKDIVARLLNAGAHKTLRDTSGKTALDYAGDDLEIINLLAPSREVAAKLQEMRKPIKTFTDMQEI